MHMRALLAVVIVAIVSPNVALVIIAVAIVTSR